MGVVTVATKAMASNMDMVMSSKAMAMASNRVMGTASHKVMAMAETRAMDNMVIMVATKVMVIKAVMVAIRAMDKVATVATRAMDSRVAMVATRAMAMRGMVATKAMAVSLIRVMANKATVPNRDTANKVMASRRDMVRTKVTAINKAVTATASNKVTQGAVTELTTDLTSHVPTMIRVMGSKATTVATRAMDSKEATVETKAMANKTMVATRAMNSLATAKTKVPSTSKGLATPSNHRSNTIIITAENTRRTPATSLPSRTVKRDLGTPWTWRRTPTAARVTATRTNTERYSTLCRRLFSLVFVIIFINAHVFIIDIFNLQFTQFTERCTKVMFY